MPSLNSILLFSLLFPATRLFMKMPQRVLAFDTTRSRDELSFPKPPFLYYFVPRLSVT